MFGGLKQFGLLLHLGKCKFARKCVWYLGHVISEEGIEPDPDKVEAVWNFPIPTSAHTVRQFTGLASYYRRFVPNFAKIAVLLHALTRENVPFFWSMTCQGAFLTHSLP